jgi:hypothetical protein
MDFLSLVQCLCCQVEVSATGRSLVQRSPTDCGVSVCDQVKINNLDTCCEQVEEGSTAKRITEIMHVISWKTQVDLRYVLTVEFAPHSECSVFPLGRHISVNTGRESLHVYLENHREHRNKLCWQTGGYLVLTKWWILSANKMEDTLC